MYYYNIKNVITSDTTTSNANQGVQTITYEQHDGSSIYINPGVIQIEENLYTLTSQVDFTATNMLANTQYALYIGVPTGNELETQDVTITNIMPTKGVNGYFHQSILNLRCIGFLYSDASSQIGEFNIFGDTFQLANSFVQYSEASAPAAQAETTLLNIPLGGISTLIHVYTAQALSNVFVRVPGSNSSGVRITRGITSTMHIIPTGVNKKVEWKYVTNGSPVFIDIVGICFPKLICTV